jgi:hypothetical protein
VDIHTCNNERETSPGMGSHSIQVPADKMNRSAGLRLKK